jgi:hypothetical protein
MVAACCFCQGAALAPAIGTLARVDAEALAAVAGLALGWVGDG